MKTNKHFIVCEAIDGAGKGTQVALLKEWCKSNTRKSVIFTCEHTRKSAASSKIEAILHGKEKMISSKALQTLFVQDRAWHLDNVIAPALQKGSVVVSDRFWISTLVYGILDPSLTVDELVKLHEEIIGDNMILPGLTIFLDVPVDIAMQRLIVRGEPTTIFEKKAKLQQVRQAYLDIGPTFGEFVTVDGVGSPKEVSERVIEVVYSHII